MVGEEREGDGCREGDGDGDNKGDGDADDTVIDRIVGKT